MEAGFFLILELPRESDAFVRASTHRAVVRRDATAQRVAFTCRSISSGVMANVTRLTDCSLQNTSFNPK